VEMVDPAATEETNFRGAERPAENFLVKEIFLGKVKVLNSRQRHHPCVRA